MKYDEAFFDEEINRRGTACEKWDGLMKRENRVTNPMWVADMDFRCPDEVKDALVARASHPIYGYTEQTQAATDAMLSFMRRRHGLELQADEQAMLPCVVTGLRAAVLTFTKPDDRVILQPPVYGPFYASVRDNGRAVAECPLLSDASGRYTMDLASVERACQEGAKAMFLCNPHNPVGRAWTREELLSLWQVLKKYDVLLISDEIHEDFVYEQGAFTPMLRLVEADDAKLISLTSASKTFNLAGLQQAAAFSRNKAMLKAMTDTMRSVGVVQGNIFAMIATEAAFTHGDAWLDAMLSYIRKGERLLRDELSRRLPKAVFSPLEATYLGWLDLRAYGLSTVELMERCRDAGVEFTPGTFFGQETGEGFVRINLACPHSRVLTAAKQLEKALLG